MINVDMSEIGVLAKAFQQAGSKTPLVLSRGLNKAGLKARTQMRRDLVGQTGLKYGVFVRALRSTSATPSSLAFVIKSKGGNVSLKFFKPREGKGGVTARPWNGSTFYRGAFTKSGGGRRKTKRFKSPKLKGQVFVNVDGGRWRGRIAIVKSGLFIPEEMVTGRSASAFNAAVTQELPTEVGRALLSILSAGAPRGVR